MTDLKAGSKGNTRLVAREAGGTVLATGIGAPLRYITVLCTTRVLGAGGFGAYTLAMTLVNVASVLSVMGLSPGVLPFLSKARKTEDTGAVLGIVRAAITMVACTSLAACATLWLLAPWLGLQVFHKNQLPLYLRSLSPMIFLGALGIVTLTLVQGFLAVKERALVEKVFSVGVTGVGMAFTWWFGWGLTGVAASTLAGGAATILGGLWNLRKRSPGFLFGGRASSWPVRQLVGYSWPLMGTSMLSFLLLWSDLLVMGLFRRSYEVGVYGLASRLALSVLMAHESITPIFTPRLSDLHAAGKHEQISHLYKLTARWAMWPGLATAWGLILWGGPLMRLFGPEFRGGTTALSLLALGKAFSVATGMSGNFLAVTGRTRLHLSNMILLVGMNLVLNLVWTPTYGGAGAAAATCISLIGVNCLRTAQVWRFHRILPWGRGSLPAILGPFLAAILLVPFRTGPEGAWGWVLPFGIYCAGCMALFLKFGVTEEDREVWKALKGKLGIGTSPSDGGARQAGK